MKKPGLPILVTFMIVLFPVWSWGVMGVEPSGQPIQGGQPLTITWVPEGDEATFNLFYSYNKITWIRIVSGITSNVYDTWTAPPVSKTKNLWIKVVAKNARGVRLRAAESTCANRIYDKMVITSPFPCNRKLGRVGEQSEVTWTTDITDVSNSTLWFKPEGRTFRQIAEEPGNPGSIVFTIPKTGVTACNATVTLMVTLEDAGGVVIAQDTATGNIKTNWHPDMGGRWTGSFEEQGYGSFSASAFVRWPSFSFSISPNSKVSVPQSCGGTLEWTACTSADFVGACLLPTGYYYPCTGNQHMTVEGSWRINLEGTRISFTGSNQCDEAFWGSLTK